jgi:CRISPR system Cascade subunit CasC
MERFVQIHLLTSYPPANLNRDDLGRPKTAVMGGVPRLRISSQSLKRAWRTSDVFEQALENHIGTRTKSMGRDIYKKLQEKGVGHENSLKWARQIAGVFGKNKDLTKKEKDELKSLTEEERLQKQQVELDIEQLAHFSPEEQAAIDALVEKLAAEDIAPTKEDLNLLREEHKAVDIALFGRMLADHPVYNTEAAAQVAHAISVHRVTIEDDYFTAVDDLNAGVEDMGAGHIGETEFAAGLFYLYLCIDRISLVKNLSGDGELASKTLAALVESAATVAPKGKQNSFASRAYASYILSERGDEQPRSLSVAFLKPITGTNMLVDAIENMDGCRKKINDVYGINSIAPSSMNAHSGDGTLKEIIAYATEGMT